MQWLSLLHSFIQLSLNSGSAQVQTLLAACPRFAMVRISDNGNKAKRLSSVNHTTKTIHHHHHHQKALIKILKKILSVIVLLTKLWSISYGALNFNEGKIEFTMEDLKEMIEQSISVRSGIQQCTV